LLKVCLLARCSWLPTKLGDIVFLGRRRGYSFFAAAHENKKKSGMADAVETVPSCPAAIFLAVKKKFDPTTAYRCGPLRYLCRSEFIFSNEGPPLFTLKSRCTAKRNFYHDCKKIATQSHKQPPRVRVLWRVCLLRLLRTEVTEVASQPCKSRTFLSIFVLIRSRLEKYDRVGSFWRCES